MLVAEVVTTAEVLVITEEEIAGEVVLVIAVVTGPELTEEDCSNY